MNFHTSLGPQHDIIMIPTPSSISKPKPTGIIIKEEKLNFTYFLFQDAQDPWTNFLPLSQHLQQLQDSSLSKASTNAYPPNFQPPNQNPPPLKLITNGKRILQTDASDESWGTILLEEINGKESFIAYASGHFSDTQQHYHSVYKEHTEHLDLLADKGRAY